MHHPTTHNWSLLLADTDATQAYVFESNKLPEIRGASRILDELNRETARALIEDAGGVLIFAGGGSLMARVPQDRAAGLIHDIEQLYIQSTTVASISVDARPLPANFTQYNFGREIVPWGMRWLRRRKESKAPPPFIESLPFQARCPSCQLRPANAVGEFRLPLCTVCTSKWKTGGKQSGGARWYELFNQWLRENGQEEAYYISHPSADVDIPFSLSEIGGKSETRSGSIGFIYLDGDRIGDLLAQMQTEEAYQNLSKNLTDKMQAVVFEALAAELKPRAVEASELRSQMGAGQTNVTIYPFEIIVIGGDDVLLITPADEALTIARRIGQAFGVKMTEVVQSLPQSETRAVTMSGGVVLANASTPVRLLRELADQLKKEAKKKGGALDFQVLKSVDMVGSAISEIRSAPPYTLPEAGTQQRALRLLARPYAYADLEKLLQGVSDLKAAGFATSQMNLLAESLLRGRREATLFYLYQRARHKDQEKMAYGALEKLLGELQKPTAHDPLPWQALDDPDFSHQTALWDIAELYELV